jgi:hypothetical protein
MYMIVHIHVYMYNLLTPECMARLFLCISPYDITILLYTHTSGSRPVCSGRRNPERARPAEWSRATQNSIMIDPQDHFPREADLFARLITVLSTVD